MYSKYTAHISSLFGGWVLCMYCTYKVRTTWDYYWLNIEVAMQSKCTACISFINYGGDDILGLAVIACCWQPPTKDNFFGGKKVLARTCRHWLGLVATVMDGPTLFKCRFFWNTPDSICQNITQNTMKLKQILRGHKNALLRYQWTRFD